MAGCPGSYRISLLVSPGCHMYRQRISHKTGALTQTFDFACGLSHCAVRFTGINFANFT
jgi:DnaA family protein